VVYFDYIELGLINRDTYSFKPFSQKQIPPKKVGGVMPRPDPEFCYLSPGTVPGEAGAWVTLESCLGTRHYLSRQSGRHVAAGNATAFLSGILM
jgi:hypothetical protein